MKKITTVFSLGLALSVVGGCHAEDESAVAGDVTQILDDAGSCPLPPPDFAEQFFTEADRQWYCSVVAEGFTTEDQLYFDRNGQALSTRFREVFWNRALDSQSLNVASPFIEPILISNITSSNTVLMFELLRQSGEVENYDCVLVGRDSDRPTQDFM